MTANDLIAAFEALAESPEGVKRLRELVLQLAVRGKLVPQDAGDVNVNRRRSLPSSGEFPFDLPEGWRWLRLPEVADYAVGKTPATKEPRFWGAREIPWVSIGDMLDGGVLGTTNRTVTADAANEVFRKPPAKAGTLLMSFKLTIGKIAVLGVDAYHNEAIISISPKSIATRDYLFRVLPMMARGGESKDAIMGSTLNGQSLARILVPLPPLAEQHRIVARVDELMSLLDRLEAARAQRDELRRAARDAALAALRDAEDSEAVEAAWGRIAGHMDTLFAEPEDVAPLRQAVLQLAVRGRLVPQDPNDETARVLLGSRGYLPNNPPWRLPNGWAWTTLAMLGEVLGGGTPSKSNPAYWAGDIPWVSPKDMKVPWLSDSQDHVSAAAVRESSTKLIPAGAVLMVVRGMILAHSFPVAVTMVDVTVNQDMKALIPYRSGLAPFLLLLMQGSRDRVLGLVEHSTHGTCKLPFASLSTLPIPIPPLAEQHRIVAKVDALMALCDTLEARLTAARDAQAAFAAAAVHHLDV